MYSTGDRFKPVVVREGGRVYADARSASMLLAIPYNTMRARPADLVHASGRKLYLIRDESS